MRFSRNRKQAPQYPAATSEHINLMADSVMRIRDTNVPKQFEISLKAEPRLTHYAAFQSATGLGIRLSLHRNGMNPEYPHIRFAAREAIESDLIDEEHISLDTVYMFASIKMMKKNYVCESITSTFLRLEDGLLVPALRGAVAIQSDEKLPDNSRDLRRLNAMYGLAELSVVQCAELTKIAGEFNPDLATAYPNAGL